MVVWNFTLRVRTVIRRRLGAFVEYELEFNFLTVVERMLAAAVDVVVHAKEIMDMIVDVLGNE